MIERHRGAVLMIGSGAGHVFMPGSATYVATKHFVDGLSETLRLEVAGTGVRVTQVCPGPVETEFNAAAGIGDLAGGPPRSMRISAEQCAREAWEGLDRDQALVFPGRGYRALMAFWMILPRPLQRRFQAKAARGLRLTVAATAASTP
jgi:hypothetical protein